MTAGPMWWSQIGFGLPSLVHPRTSQTLAMKRRRRGGCLHIVEEVCRRRGMEGRAAMSVCSGRGQTLKGRDLCDFRDYVLWLTGFLER
ncbi:hypothetical protein ZIOFF_064615 [Zingiber officinale]|uniref:Uncharacterized protein n=1 Tax=Zingiber officinale TaxID=94328 RepID=A0A8J5KAK3_ZINOF|nr:hypothetical protein ZIOFF_064615 [Zingiber officinale]